MSRTQNCISWTGDISHWKKTVPKSLKSSGRFSQRTFADPFKLKTSQRSGPGSTAPLALAFGKQTVRKHKMHVKEIWRYPVKSMAGESLDRVHIDKLGLADDRKVLVRNANGRVLTSRTHHKLLGLKGSLGADGQPHIDGYLWNVSEALARV